MAQVLESEREESPDLDAVLAELEAEEDNDLSSLRGKRLEELNRDAKLGSKDSAYVSSAGAKQQATYQTLKSDDETLQFTTEHEKAVVHFFHPDFARCSIMDDHLTKIAQKHDDFGSDESEVKFAKVDVNNAAFVVQKLGIRVLPCVIGFVKGAIKGRIVGFEGLCWDGREKDSKVLRAVEETMVEWGCLRRKLIGRGEDSDGSDEEVEERAKKNARRGIRDRKQEIRDEDDDWD